MLPKAPQIINSLLSTCLLLSVMFYPTKAQNPPAGYCPAAYSNYTKGSPYQSNLNLTLASLASNISSNGFYTTNFGTNPNKVYGLLQCRADISYEDCKICANNSKSLITANNYCPNKTEAVLFSEHCTLRYAGNRFFSIPSTTPLLYIFRTENISNQGSFSYAVEDLLNNISTKAASNASKFSVGTTALTDSLTIFGMAQCTRDLSNDGCLECLKALITSFVDCCYGKRGGLVFSASCNYRYDLVPFFNSSLLPSPPPASPPPPTASPPPSVLESPRNNEATDALKEKGSGSGTKKPLVIITISVLLAFFVLGSGVCFIFREKIIQKVRKVSPESMKSFIRRNYEKYGKIDYQGEKNGDLDLNFFDMDTIVKATCNFSDISLLGQGGFGCVYKGTLEDGEEIAVKRLSKNSGQGVEEFKNEVLLIARLQHRNLVRLLGLCAEEQEKILVYEYMENKSLDAFLFDKTLNNILDWPKRFNIIMGISRGLLYLHQDSRFRIIHRDLKTSNVLLDSEMNPKISDFGMARIFGGDDAETETKRVVGTYGYMSPEYAMYGIFSVKSDVFSFGVIVLEIISGKKNRGIFCSEEQLSLLGYAWKLWKEGQALELIDETVKDSFLPNHALRCIQIGLLCVQENAKDRPTMPSVVLMLSTDATKLQQPRQPGFSYDKSYLGTDTSTSKRGSCSANDLTFTNLEAR